MLSISVYLWKSTETGQLRGRKTHFWIFSFKRYKTLTSSKRLIVEWLPFSYLPRKYSIYQRLNCNQPSFVYMPSIFGDCLYDDFIRLPFQQKVGNYLYNFLDQFQPNLHELYQVWVNSRLFKWWPRARLSWKRQEQKRNTYKIIIVQNNRTLFNPFSTQKKSWIKISQVLSK